MLTNTNRTNFENIKTLSLKRHKCAKNLKHLRNFKYLTPRRQGSIQKFDHDNDVVSVAGYTFRIISHQHFGQSPKPLVCLLMFIKCLHFD